MTFHRASEPRTRSPACKDRGRGRLTWPFAGEPLYGVSVSDPDSRSAPSVRARHGHDFLEWLYDGHGDRIS